MSAATKKKTKPKTRRKTATRTRATRRPGITPKKQEPLPPAAPTKKESAPAKVSYLVAIRLKGSFGTPWPLQKALETLRLRRKFNAVLLENTHETIGMLRAVKDYVTWGEANTNDIASVLRERGEILGGGEMTDETIRRRFGEASVADLATALTDGRISLRDLWRKGISPVFRLHPPSGGFEGSAKRPYGSRGELGMRGNTLTTLLARMT